MISPEHQPERRSSARLVESLSFNLGYDGFQVSANTINISSTGILCSASKNIPVMTKVEMMLVLPSRLEENPMREIKIGGVVVRTEVHDRDYRIAIFFTDITQSNRKRLDAYIQHRLGQE